MCSSGRTGKIIDKDKRRGARGDDYLSGLLPTSKGEVNSDAIIRLVQHEKWVTSTRKRCRGGLVRAKRERCNYTGGGGTRTESSFIEL